MTNGVISIVLDGEVEFKLVAGCNGFRTDDLARVLLRQLPGPFLRSDLYAAAKEIGFGCEDCLVVQDRDGELCLGDEDLSPLYRLHFREPEFNPRWECGRVDHIQVIEHQVLEVKGGKITRARGRSTVHQSSIRDPAMKALTIRQPWAEAIMAGVKRVENRTWSTKYRGWLLIHAGLKIDPAGEELLRSVGWQLPQAVADLPRGVVLGVVALVDVVSPCGLAEDPLASGPLCWVLRNPRRWARPVPCKGRQGLWEYTGIDD